MTGLSLHTHLKNRWADCAALGLILMAVVQQIAWVSLAGAVETWDDDAGLYRLATCLEDQLRGEGGACFAGAPYPPLIPAMAAIQFLISGTRGVDAAIMSLWPWTILAGVSLWLGVRRAAGVYAGLAAVAIGPVVIWSLHIRGKFYTEVPLAALAIACMVALVACEGFKRRKPSMLLGLGLGLGLLCKWSFAFFLAPPMALAWAMGLGSAAKDRHVAAWAGGGALAAVALLASGATGRLMGGLWPGCAMAALTVSGVAITHRRQPDRFEADAPARWLNLALATAVLLAVAGPWYLSHLGELQAFLADNMAQKFHGDPIGTVQGLPFYPAVLLTRVLGSPLAIVLVIGAVMAIRPGRHPLAAWSLISLVAGTLILGMLPYRAGRYLVAGLGLVTPIAILGLSRLPRLSNAAMIIVLICGIAHQLSWIPLRSGALHIPHHWPIFTLPEQDLFGNSRQGISQARSDLLHPRWRFLPIASPPVERVPAARRLVKATAKAAKGPFLLVVLDPAGRVNANSLQTELLSTRPSPLSAAIPGDVQASQASLSHWTHQARHPPDSPATAHGDSSRWLFIAMATPPADPSHSTRVEDLAQLLKRRGWSPVLQQEIEDPFEPTHIQVWGEPR